MTKEKEAEVQEKLTDFNWDDDNTFFNDGVTVLEKNDEEEEVETVEEEEIEETEKKTETTKEKTKEEKPEKTDEKKKDDDFEFFSDKEVKGEFEVDKASAQSLKDLALGLKEKGVLSNFEITEDAEDLTDEDFDEIISAEADARANEAIDGFMEELDEDAKRFIKFKKDGGKTEEFFKVVSESTNAPTGDIEDEKYQKKISEYYLRNVENLEDEDIEDRIEWLKEGGKLASYAKKYQEKVESLKAKKEAEVLKKASDEKKRQQDEALEFQKTLKTVLEKTDKIKDFTISKKDKNELATYISKPAVKTGTNKFITQFQADMQNVTKNYDTLILLAKLVKNGFSIEGVKREISTKETAELKKTVEKQKQNIKTKSSGSSGVKSLHEYFND